MLKGFSLKGFNYGAPETEHPCPPRTEADKKFLADLQEKHGQLYLVEGNWHYSCPERGVDWMFGGTGVLSKPRAREYNVRQKRVNFD